MGHMEFRWSPEKDEWLKRERGISFVDLVAAYNDGKILGIEPHPKKTQQILILFEKDNYVYIAPCVQESTNVYFLKTIYPSRKATKRYLSI